MIGMNRETGALMSGDDHLAQSIGDILSTPIGTRPMRRDYGSLLFEMVDRPNNPATRLLCIMATAIALARWEPRLAIDQVTLTGEFALGTMEITVTGRRTDTTNPNAVYRLTIPIR